jgi:isochorismate hydrolase
MASQSPRSSVTDPRLPPQNAALLLIDDQRSQVNTIRSMDSATLVANVRALAKTAKLFDLPVVLSSVCVTFNSFIIPIFNHSLFPRL